MNLGVKYDEKESMAMPKSTSGDKTSYPTLYVSGIKKEGDLPDGEFTFTGKGKLVSKTETNRNGKETYSFEIEVHDLTPTSKAVKSKEKDSGEALDEALTKIETDKSGDMEDE